MTIALGVLTPDHLIFAADSQEGDGITKLDVGKIAFSADLHRDSENKIVDRAVVLTGAGNSGYLNYMADWIVRRFKDSEMSVDEFETYLKTKIRKFHELHVPLTREQTIELVVAAQCNGERRMWVTNLSTVRRVASYAVVGFGNTWARKALTGFIPGLTDHRSATVIAAYAAFTAKQHAESCGMDTYIVSIHRSGRLFVADPVALRKLDDYFREYEDRERMARLATMGMCSIQTAAGLRNIESFLSTMHDKLASLDIYSGWLGETTSPATSPRPQSTKGDSSRQPPLPESPGGSGES